MKSLLPFLFITLFALSFSCDTNGSDNTDQDPNKLYERELANLELLKTTIISLANASVCGGSFECRYIPFGSKPCGGAWSYLIYSTSINFIELETLVISYNEKTSNFNEKWDITSDCSIVLPPTSVDCENNMCVAVY